MIAFDIITGTSTEATTTGSIIFRDEYLDYLNFNAQLIIYLSAIIIFLLCFFIILKIYDK